MLKTIINLIISRITIHRRNDWCDSRPESVVQYSNSPCKRIKGIRNGESCEAEGNHHNRISFTVTFFEKKEWFRKFSWLSPTGCQYVCPPYWSRRRRHPVYLYLFWRGFGGGGIRAPFPPHYPLCPANPRSNSTGGSETGGIGGCAGLGGWKMRDSGGVGADTRGCRRFHGYHHPRCEQALHVILA